MARRPLHALCALVLLLAMSVVAGDASGPTTTGTLYLAFDVEKTFLRIPVPEDEREGDGHPGYTYAIDRDRLATGAFRFRPDGEGLPVAFQESKVDIRVGEDGAMWYREWFAIPGREGHRDLELGRALDLGGFGVTPGAFNPVMALHPLAMITPEFAPLREAGYGVTESRELPGGTLVAESETWRWVLEVSEGDTPQPERLRQYDIATGAVVRETTFEDWTHMPSGRFLPSTVRTHTTKPDGTRVVEVVFTNITEQVDPARYLD